MVVVAIAQWDDFIAGQTCLLYTRVLCILIWCALYYFIPRQAPLMSIIIQFTHGMTWFFFFDELQTEDEREFELLNLMLIISLTAISYTTFKQYFLFMIPAILIPHLLVMNKIAA